MDIAQSRDSLADSLRSPPSLHSAFALGVMQSVEAVGLADVVRGALRMDVLGVAQTILAKSRRWLGRGWWYWL